MKYSLLFIALILLAGCGKTSIDNTDPNIEVFLINGAEQNITHTVGSDLAIELHISDNEQLQEVLIKIENISNGGLSPAQKLFHFEVIEDIDSKNFNEVILVPSGEHLIAGRYNVQLQVVDANGNVDTDNKEFVLLNPGHQPAVEIESYDPPLQDGLITMQRGETLVVNGWILDDTGLAQFTVSLTGPQELHNQWVGIQEPDITSNSFESLDNPMVPTDAETGDYSFNVEVVDEDGHMTFFAQPVKVE